MSIFLYRRGNGNEGNFPRLLVELKPTDSPWAAMRALVLNDYIAGKRVRRHIARAIEVDGEPEFGMHATVYDGPDGETEFGAAYLTAELEPVRPDDMEYMIERYGRGDNPGYGPNVRAWRLRELLDRGALADFRKGNRE